MKRTCFCPSQCVGGQQDLHGQYKRDCFFIPPIVQWLGVRTLEAERETNNEGKNMLEGIMTKCFLEINHQIEWIPGVK